MRVESRFWAGLLIVLSLSAVASADCVRPSDGQSIVGDAVLCPGIYDLPGGISVSGNRVTFDCGNALLRGSGFGTGIRSNATVLTLAHCSVSNYEAAMRFEGNDVVKVFASSLQNSSIGFHVLGVRYFDEKGNSFSGNDRDKVIEDVAVLPEEFVLPNLVSDSLLSELGVAKQDFDAAKSLVRVSKRAIIGDGKTTVIIDIVPSEDIDVEVVERIPKSLAASISDVTPGAPFVKVINLDPDAVLYVGKLRVKTKLNLNYTVSKEASREDVEDAVTVVSRKQTVEDAIPAVPPSSPPVAAEPPVIAEPQLSEPPPAEPQPPTQASRRSTASWLVYGLIAIVLFSLAYWFGSRRRRGGQPVEEL